MARRVFFSFHYIPDSWRTSQVRNIGRIEGNRAASDNDWETVKRGGDTSIKNWIDGQLVGRSCTIVLIGTNTAGRKWIKYEIEQSWKEGKGLFGIYIHNLKDSDGRQSLKGVNPFSEYNLKDIPFASIVKTYDPPYYESKNVYEYISTNIENWIDEAIEIRNRY